MTERPDAPSADPASAVPPADPPARPGWPRRQVILMSLVGAGAAAGGLLAALKGEQPSAGPDDSGVDAAVPGFWALQFEQPSGGVLALERFRGRPLVVNFWATWCPPCVEEMPLLDRFQREHAAKGWQVLGLAIDSPSAVRQFLERIPVSFAIGLAGLQGTELGRQMGNLTGGLPFTVVLAADGAVVQRKMGKVTASDLQTWVSIR